MGLVKKIKSHNKIEHDCVISKSYYNVVCYKATAMYMYMAAKPELGSLYVFFGYCSMADAFFFDLC